MNELPSEFGLVPLGCKRTGARASVSPLPANNSLPFFFLNNPSRLSTDETFVVLVLFEAASTDDREWRRCQAWVGAGRRSE